MTDMHAVVRKGRAHSHAGACSCLRQRLCPSQQPSPALATLGTRHPLQITHSNLDLIKALKVGARPGLAGQARPACTNQAGGGPVHQLFSCVADAASMPVPLAQPGC